jgi:Tfp pilus assembly protein PilO
MKRQIGHGNWIVTALVSAAAVAYFALVFLPGRQSISEARREIHSKQDFIASAGALAVALKTAQDELGKADAFASAWEEDAPAPSELAAVYGTLHELAKAAGTTITRLNPEPVVPYDAVRKIPLTMGCTGTFAQIFEFLRSLEALDMEIWEEDIRLERMQGNNEYIASEIKLVVFTGNPENSGYVEQSE